jgi:hypothetical protein
MRNYLSRHVLDTAPACFDRHRRHVGLPSFCVEWAAFCKASAPSFTPFHNPRKEILFPRVRTFLTRCWARLRGSNPRPGALRVLLLRFAPCRVGGPPKICISSRNSGSLKFFGSSRKKQTLGWGAEPTRWGRPNTRGQKGKTHTSCIVSPSSDLQERAENRSSLRVVFPSRFSP